MRRKKEVFGFVMILVLAIISTSFVYADTEAATNVKLNLSYTQIYRTADAGVADSTGQWEIKLENDPGAIIYLSCPLPNENIPRSAKKISINYPLLESKYCTRTTNVMNQYMRLSDTMSSMLKVCEGAVTQFNASEAHIRELNDARLKQTEFESLWNVEKNKREVLENSLDKCEADLEEFKRENSQLSVSANLASQRGTELNVCKEDLEDAENAKTNQLIFGGIAGLVGGYLFWGRKKNNSGSNSRLPPEQEDALDPDY